MFNIRLKWMTVIPIGAFFLLSCMREQAFDPETDSSDAILLNIEGAIDQVHTKVNASGFVDGDAIGLYAVNYLERNSVAGTLANSGNQADNAKYVFDENAHKWTPIRPVYFKNIDTNVDIYTYYPYTQKISDVAAFGFEVQKDQSSAASAGKLGGYEASDFLWGKAANVAPTEKTISVKLQHRLSGVQVILQEGSAFADGEFEALGKNVSVLGTTRKATINFSTGVATPVGAAQTDGIVMAPQEDGSFRAVVIPQAVAGGSRLFAITLGTQSYYYAQEAEASYQTGKMTQFTIRVSKKTASGQYELELADAQIVDWTEDRNTHGGEARQYYVVNVTEPGTLGRLIKNAKKNPDKIRNLKVTGTVTTEDFYFMRDSMAILEAVNMKESKVVNVRTNSETKDDVIPDYAFYNKTSLFYFVFPEIITSIGSSSFNKSSLSGALIIPDDVVSIEEAAFYQTNISTVTFSNSLESINDSAFAQSKATSGALYLPENLKSIGPWAFSGCGFSSIHLPISLEEIDFEAFSEMIAPITGDLAIPEKIKTIHSSTFRCTHFSGRLDLGNVQEIERNAFYQCGFSGELRIPEGVTELGGHAFMGNNFNSIVFPSTLKIIRELCFFNNNRISEPLIFPEGFLTIERQAFYNANLVPSISLPTSTQTIGANAFNDCYYISSIVCNAIEPPIVQDGAFNGVAKDNFTVEVPPQSVKRYQGEAGWSDFRRIAGHYDFSLSRQCMRSLDESFSKTFVLRAPSGFKWSIQDKPDWVTVSPSSGLGKTDVTITVSAMNEADVATFETNEGTFLYPSYRQYEGRSGEIVFLLDEKNYVFKMDVEQYHSSVQDGQVKQLQTATKGPGIDFVFTGDGYDAKDIATGVFTDNAEEGYEHLFELEPYKTYKEYFNVYAVAAMSDDSGIGTVNTVVDTKFGSYFTQNRILCPGIDSALAWAKKADSRMDFTKSLVILLQNTTSYEGICYMYTDGSALACVPVSREAYPYDFRGIVQHEAGGHGFGKLADEYIYHNAFIQTCNCTDGCDHPSGENDFTSVYGRMKALGWYKNISLTSDNSKVPWAHLLYNPQFSDYVDMYEGAYMHSRGVYRSEATSCMNNNIPYYSAISRQAIVERIMKLAGEEFTLEKFYQLDSDEFGTKTKAPISLPFDFPVRTSGHEMPILVGEHPNVQ